jgi:hypothetical protein
MTRRSLSQFVFRRRLLGKRDSAGEDDGKLGDIESIADQACRMRPISD